MSSKTEEPTPKRLRKAETEGDSPVSGFASQAIAFCAAVAVAPAAAMALATYATTTLRTRLAAVADHPAATTDVTAVARDVLVLSAPILGVAAVASAMASIVQSPVPLAPRKVLPDLSRLDPRRGLANLFSTTRLFTLGRAFLFATILGYFAYQSASAHLEDVARSAGRWDATFGLAGTMSLEIVRRAVVVGLGFAVVDVLWTRRAWRRRLMMTKDEVRREHKESEADPEFFAARKRAHQEMLAGAALHAIKDATVVITNPTHLACALRYSEALGDEAPTLVASGQGDMAARIVAEARLHGIPVLEDVPLARALVVLEVGTAIPEALFEAVATILRDLWDYGEGPSARPIDV